MALRGSTVAQFTTNVSDVADTHIVVLFIKPPPLSDRNIFVFFIRAYANYTHYANYVVGLSVDNAISQVVPFILDHHD